MAKRIFGRYGAGLKTVTKAELLDLLDVFKPDDLIVFSFNYGDHSRTEAIDGITRATVRELDETAYSPSGFSVFEPDAQDGDRDEGEARDDNGDPIRVVVLS